MVTRVCNSHCHRVVVQCIEKPYGHGGSSRSNDCRSAKDKQFDLDKHIDEIVLIDELWANVFG